MFVLTFPVFRGIHPPSWRILGDFVAFVMGGLGLFVIKIYMGGSKEKCSCCSAQEVFDSDSVGFSTVGQSAMLIRST